MDAAGDRLHNSNMRQPEAAPPAAALSWATGSATGWPTGLPSYALYGEPGQPHATDWLHCESIAERSRRHDWEIKPHRHEALIQFLYMRSGRAQALLESAPLALAGPCLLRVPAGVPHGFRFEPTVDGVVVTVLEAHLKRLLAPVPALAERLLRPQLLACAANEAAAQVAQAVGALLAEFNGQAPWRTLALDAALLRLAVLVARLSVAALAHRGEVGHAGDLGRCGAAAGASVHTPKPARALAHVQRFRALVEQRFRQQPALADLAAELGITPTQLNRVCQQVLGHSALGLLHARLVLEAQRELTYTTQPVKQVAHGLGFADSGYFTRFFGRHSGHTPSAWRALTLAAR